MQVSFVNYFCVSVQLDQPIALVSAVDAIISTWRRDSRLPDGTLQRRIPLTADEVAISKSKPLAEMEELKWYNSQMTWQPRKRSKL